jgi:hypothetical protein
VGGFHGRLPQNKRHWKEETVLGQVYIISLLLFELFILGGKRIKTLKYKN